jgi:4-cresol dehydrogenase (hydroxylating)
MNKDPNFQSALMDWTRAIGPEFVITEKKKIEVREFATMEVNFSILAILQPKNTEEVSAVVKIAAKYVISIHPISSGFNWGYGSGSPNRDNVVLLDLQRLTTIAEVNEELAYATIGAGVTYVQLTQFLNQHFARRLLADPTGASPNSSVLGNAIERGHGLGPYCDHFASLGGMKVVLANGEVLQTGYGIFGDGQLAEVDSFGVGPVVSGLFSQSGFGILTEATIFLAHAPESSAVVSIGFNNVDLLTEKINVVKELRMKNIIRSGPQISNGYAFLSRIMQYPWDRMNQQTPLSEKVLQELLAEKSGSYWTITFSTYGLRGEVEACLAEIRGKLSHGVDRFNVIRLEELADGIDKPWLQQSDSEKLFWLMSGGIGGNGLPRGYWRNSKKCPENVFEINLDQDRCGLINVGLAVPFTGKVFNSVVNKVSDIILKNGFEPCLGCSAVRPRTMLIHAFICFDRESAQEAERAQGAIDEILEEMVRMGYAPYRLGTTSMSFMSNSNEVYKDFFWRIKDAIDSQHILAPGRYEPERPKPLK